MVIPYRKYCDIKDRVCISYSGYCSEYVLLMKLIRPYLQKALPGLSIWLSCNDDLFYLLDGANNIVTGSKLTRRHEFFGFVKEVSNRMQRPHPIEQLLSESNVPIPVLQSSYHSASGLCCIYSNGILPTRSLSASEIDKCKIIAVNSGYDVWLNPPPAAAKDAGWVIGVEGEALFQAAITGQRTSLVPTGIGTTVYQNMFPAGEVLKNITS